MPDSIVGGLAPGTSLPNFQGRDADGVERTQRDLLGHRILLIFVQASCPYSARIFPLLASRSVATMDGATPVLIVSSDPLTPPLRLPHPVIELGQGKFAARFGLRGTPAAYLVDERGRTLGPALVGARAILAQFGLSPKWDGLDPGWEMRIMPYPSPGTRVADALREAFPDHPPARIPESTLRDRLARRRRVRCVDGPTGDTNERGVGGGPPRRVPLVSVVIATRDRPSFLPLALRCFELQTYPSRELIVVDDGQENPVDGDTVRAVGGRLVRTQHLTLGEKLNFGVAAAQGTLFAKMDDDDWYGPGYLERMAAALLAGGEDDPPEVVFPGPYLVLSIADWSLRRSPDRAGTPAGSLAFTRAHWRDRPFRALQGSEDTRFLKDTLQSGSMPRPVHTGDQFVVTRHRGGRRDRPHSWTYLRDERVEDSMRRWPACDVSPEEVLPAWANATYQDLRQR
jgi:hypothetical protein